MRRSKYDDVVPTQPHSEKDIHTSEIDKRIELSSEIINLNQQIESIKILSQDLKTLGTLAINAIDANKKSSKALNAAVKSSENIINGICSAITRAENTTISVVLSPEDKAELASHRKALIDEERMLLETHLHEMKRLLESHQKATHKYLKSESGFFLTGWISKYSLITFWVLYAYFCLTLCFWLFCTS